MTSLIFLLVVLVLQLLFIVIFCFLLFFGFLSFFLSAPFVPMRKVTLGAIVEALSLAEGSVLYDLGCGDGRVLIEAVKRVPHIQAIGLEQGVIPYLVAKYRTRNLPVEIRFENIFHVDLAHATHVFLYLSKDATQTLYTKIKKECKPGTKIVTCDFTIQDIVPEKIVTLPESKSNLSKALYVYTLVK